jgi:hypothetical protein
MQPTPEQTEELRSLIIAELDLCDVVSTPIVCKMNTPENQPKLVDLVLQFVMEQDITIGHAILEVEKSYNVNMLLD